MSDNRGLRHWLSAWIPVALGVAVIALESTEWMGADHTSGPLRVLFQALFGPIPTSPWEHGYECVTASLGELRA